MDKSVAVLATGAIGGSISADLVRAGHPALLIDQWPAHVEAMKTHGLRVTMPGESFQVKVDAIHLCELASRRPQLDIVFLAAKSYDTRWLVELIKPYLKPDGVIVSAQNSLNDEWIIPVVGRERDIPCVVELSAEVFEPGVVKRNTDRTHTRFVVGELDGTQSSRVKEVAVLLSAVGQTEVSSRIWNARWTKLVVNTMIMALDAAAGLKTSDLADNPKFISYSVRLGRETMEVASALGYSLEPIFGMTPEEFIGSSDAVLQRMLRKLLSDVGREARSATLQDILKGRRTETDLLNGLVVRKGKEADIATPVNEALTVMFKEVEEGRLKPSPSNLEVLDRSM